MKVYKCEHCGNIVEMIADAGVNPVCCGEKMKELVPGTSDGAVEKHVPVVTVSGNTVTVAVGEAEHPMLDAHYIQWIVLETENGVYRKALKPGEKSGAVFALTEGEKALAAYEYCNLHGLWKAEIK